MQDGKIAIEHTGKVTDNNIEDAKESAKICAINIIAHLKASINELDRVKKIVKISGFVNSDPLFYKHPNVINTASDFLFEVFGEKAKSSRIAVGVASLPLNVMTEIDAIVEIQ